MECIFCKIINKIIKSEIIYEDDDVLAIKDINPQAPVHILIIPKKHYEKLYEIEDVNLLGKLLILTSKIALQENIKDSGYRIVINTNRNAGQSVNHVHIHLLGGRIMTWPPG